MESSSNKITNLFAHSVTGKTDDSFVGIKIIGNEIHLYYPETYRFDPNSDFVRIDIINLLRTISIAKTASAETSRAYNSHTKNGEFALMSYLWVINDYLQNGFYVNREKIYKTNQSGRVNWKRTLQTQPIISNVPNSTHKNIIYPNLIVEVKNSVDNLLVEIHKYCVKKSIAFIGWLFNLNESRIETKPVNETILKVYLSTLQSELEKTFDDDKRLRLAHLKNVLIGLTERKDEDGFVYGVDSYYYVFERMIDSIFGTVKDMRDFRPKANWKLVRNDKETPSSELRPDTIIIKDNDVYILDSKFYRFGFTGKESDLPETTSIQKQITYGDYLKMNVDKMAINNIYNAFLLPYDKVNGGEEGQFKSDKDIQYIGYAKSSWKNNEQNHEIIHTFLIDLKHVVDTWNNYNHSKDVKDIINEIEIHQKEYLEGIKS